MPKKTQITVESLAELAGISTRRIYQLGEDGTIPKPNDGKMPRDEAIAGLFKWFQRDSELLKQEKLLTAIANRKQRELDLAASESKLIDRGQVIQDFQGAFRRFHILVRTELEKHSPNDLRDELARLNCPLPILATFYEFAVKRGEKTVDLIEDAAMKIAKTEPTQQ